MKITRSLLLASFILFFSSTGIDATPQVVSFVVGVKGFIE